ncbi:MurR/RpiR family transcriptional regulator [Streptomyces sp. TS71-3]|uniref:MurR/RpiR family transcriptional regulator n=1 Tax=Streptomyces sp. TS71-3 TaxID=2733862 RepID=UPI001B07CEB2|nr:MurR/RpiR family transcriptional regulator [Streptomyces sp. TS71-3]GHJ35727.1 transcriptional regulator [Streptomyces sp. TS71-3]
MATGGLIPRLRALRPELSGASGRVADRLLADPAAAAAMTIQELAAAAGTSPATVTRVCRRAGLDGYAELRIALATESGRAAGGAWQADLGEDIDVSDPPERVLAVLAARDAAAIHDTVDALDTAALEAACDALAGARRVDLYGVGGSAIVATELQLRLHRIGCAVWAWAEVHSALTSASQLGPGDVAVGISHTGETAETCRPLAVAADRGATTIALTNAPGATLARTAATVLTTSVRSLSLRPDFLAARHSQLIVLDALYMGVAQRTYGRTAQALEATAATIAEHRRAYPARRAVQRGGAGRGGEPEAAGGTGDGSGDGGPTAQGPGAAPGDGGAPGPGPGSAGTRTPEGGPPAAHPPTTHGPTTHGEGHL